MLEVVEGQVGDQVSGVPDDRWRAEGDVGRAQGFTVPQTIGQTLVQIHTPHVPVNGIYPGRETNTFCCGAPVNSVEQISAGLRLERIVPLQSRQILHHVRVRL